MIGQRVEVSHEREECNGVVTKVLNKHHCVVHWKVGEGKNIEKYNRIYPIEEVNKGRITGGKHKEIW